MKTPTFAHLRELLSEDEVKVVQVSAFWREARLARPATPEHALIAVPVTLYLAGRLSLMVQAEMPVAIGSRVRTRPPRSSFDRLKDAFRERRKAALLRFKLPDLGLFWQGEETDEHALALARHFGRVLAEEFPDAEGRLVQHFRLELPRLVEHLSKLPLMHAGEARLIQGP